METERKRKSKIESRKRGGRRETDGRSACISKRGTRCGQRDDTWVSTRHGNHLISIIEQSNFVVLTLANVVLTKA